MCDDIGHRTSLIVYPHIVPSYSLLDRQVVSGSVDIAWAPPLVALDLVASGSAVVIASLRRERGGNYHAAIFTRRDSEARSIGDLRDKRVAWVARESTSGYLVPRLWIASTGIDPASFFRHETFCQTHDEVVDAVLSGRADVGATHAAFDAATGALLHAGWSERLRNDPDAIHVIATAGPIPADTIVLASRVPKENVDSVTSALLNVTGSTVSAMQAVFGASRFDPADASHLAPIERYKSQATRRSTFDA